MPESHTRTYQTLPPDLAGRYLMLSMESTHQAERPPGGDPVIAAMWKALPFAMDRSPELSDTIFDWLKKQDVQFPHYSGHGKPVSQVAGELRGRLQYDQLRRARGFRGRTDPAIWENSMVAIGRSDERLAEFIVALGFPQNTTEGSRYGPLEVVRQLVSSPDQPEVDVLDAASSILVGINQLMRKDRFPFPDAQLYNAGAPNVMDQPQWMPDLSETGIAYNALLHGAAVPGRHVSTDLFSPRDLMIPRLSRASLRPISEILNRSFMRRFYALAGQQSNLADRHDFVQGDITNAEDMAAIRERHPDRKFRIAFAGTVMNQLGEDLIPQAVEALMQTLDGDTYEDAMLLVLDFAYPDPHDPAVIRLHNEWKPGTYSLLAIYKNDPQRRVRELFKFVGSRPNEVMISDGQIMVDGAFMGVREAILRRHRQKQ